MAMTLEILLWFSLSLCTVTLILSFNIIRRFRKIAKLTNLVYDQLVITKGDVSPLLNPKQPDAFASILEEQLLQHHEEEIHKPANVLDPAKSDFSDEPNTISDPSHTKVITKAEAHLIKVLQAKYKLNEEKTPPTGNNNS